MVYVMASLLFLVILFTYTRIILIKEQNIKHGKKAKFVIIADLHLGIFKGSKFFKRVVLKVNSIENVDAIFLLGDMFFAPDLKDISKLIEPISEFKKPIYFVWGNHDYDEAERRKLKDILTEEFAKYNVKVLNNESLIVNNMRIYGTDDLQCGSPDILEIKDGDLILAHNPDTTFLYTHRVSNTLTLSGHTHCGQIRIPFLFKYLLPVSGKWYKKYDWYDLGRGNKLYITCGLGEVYLPFRFLTTPEITILNLYD